MSTNEFRILSADHTGITVSNLERSLAFWRDILGFEFSHAAHQKGELAEEITAAKGAKLVQQYQCAPVLGELYKPIPPGEKQPVS